LPRNRVLRHCSDPPPSAPDSATAIVVLPARHRQCIHPPENLAKQTPVQMPLGKQQPIIAGMLDQPSSGLHQLMMITSLRPFPKAGLSATPGACFRAELLAFVCYRPPSSTF
jgi:hypothetical protein